MNQIVRFRGFDIVRGQAARTMREAIGFGPLCARIVAERPDLPD